MWEIFLKTLPFFALIGVGYGAGRTRFFTPEATAYLTKFVFYFALSAMLFRFSANLSLAEILDWQFVWAYLAGTMAVYLIVTVVALLRKRSVEEAAVEAQCGAIGNVGFLGIPMLTLLFGEAAIGPNMLVLAVDLIVFGSLIVILITGSRDGRMSFGILRTVGLGLLKNPMIVSIVLGLAVSSTGYGLPPPVNEFVSLLGAAATPGALFAIGASLATKSAERVAVAGWLSFAKLALHPGFVAIFAFGVFDVEPFAAGVMVAAAALPVAGNVYILAQHYGVAPQRVSAAILISTAASILTVSAIIAWVAPSTGLGGQYMETVSENRCFGGIQGVYRHRSSACDCDMTFGLFLPQEAEHAAVPVIWYLSGLTCTHENAMVKAGLQQWAAAEGVAVIFPDTSPRGEGVADDPTYDLGQGAGFYVNATQTPWAAHYRMWDYVAEELLRIVTGAFAIDEGRQSIMGHSMGGHGALTLAMNLPGRFASVSAFSPICNPSRTEWGRKQLTAYLGPDEAAWARHDAAAMMEQEGFDGPILIDTGTDDPFADHLRTEALAEAIARRRQQATVRLQKGYDHSYYFVSTFAEDHLAFHAEALFS